MTTATTMHGTLDSLREKRTKNRQYITSSETLRDAKFMDDKLRSLGVMAKTDRCSTRNNIDRLTPVKVM
jgi:hypothetical protein